VRSASGRDSTSTHALAKYTKEPWLYPSPPLTKERSFALVGVSLVSLFDPLFKRSRLHCFDICLTWCLWHIKIWWQHLVPTYRVYTAPRYATIPKLDCWHVMSVLLNISWSPPRYACIPILIWQHDLSVLLNAWLMCGHQFWKWWIHRDCQTTIFPWCWVICQERVFWEGSVMGFGRARGECYTYDLDLPTHQKKSHIACALSLRLFVCDVRWC